MLEKFIKDHPIVFGDYVQWIFSDSGRKEYMDANIMDTNLKYKVDDIYSSSTSDAKIIN